MSHNESELIDKAKAGDKASLTMLLLDHHSELVSFIERKSSDFVLKRVGVDELISQTRMYAFRGIASFEPRGPGAFGAWLRTIAHNRIVDAFRRESRRREINAMNHGPFRGGEDSCVDLFDQYAADDATPSVEVRRQEKVGAVRAAILGLTNDKHRTALELRHLQELTYEEIAIKMNCTTSAVRGYLGRGKKELLARLGQESQFFSKG